MLFAITLAFASVAAAADVEFLFQSGNEAWMHAGHVLNQADLISKYGDHFAAIVRDGHRFVITDPAALARIEEIYAPVASIAHEQKVLGEQQADIGREQARIGAEQAAAASDAAVSRDLSEQQKSLSDRQKALSDQQKHLGERMKEISRQAMPKIERIFDEFTSR